jgi:uncharacterized membrane protein YoaK (UPF0700 family)
MLRQHLTPAWVYLGGLVLTIVAGVINAVGFLGVHHQALSHMSGTVTTLGMELGRADYGVALHALAILAAFFAGCLVSGAVISQGTLRLGRRYGVTLTLESAALFLAVYFLRHESNMGDYLAALACGLQNAMVSSYSGSTMRTTHMTCMVTDLGIACGHFIRGDTVDWYKFRLYGVLFLGFFAGGVIGALSYGRFGYDTLLFPAALSGIAGVGYGLFKQYERRRTPPARP